MVLDRGSIFWMLFSTELNELSFPSHLHDHRAQIPGFPQGSLHWCPLLTVFVSLFELIKVLLHWQAWPPCGPSLCETAAVLPFLQYAVTEALTVLAQLLAAGLSWLVLALARISSQKPSQQPLQYLNLAR